MNMPLDALNDLSNEALLVLFANGDQQAARALTMRLTPRVFGQAMRMLTNTAEAEDVTQDAMLRLWKMAPDWKQEAQITTWLYRVVANLCTDRLRKRPSVDLDAIPEPVDPQPAVDDEMMQSARAQALQTALRTLPERQQQAVTLRHLEGLRNPQIADIMDLSIEAVESLIARGKRSLSAQLKDQKSELGYADDD